MKTKSSFSFCDPRSSDEYTVTDWIRKYIRPAKNVNHMYTSEGLWKMVTYDTKARISHDDFKRLMQRAGYPPADPTVSLCEYRISSAGLRHRPGARAGGWQPKRNPYYGWKMR